MVSLSGNYRKGVGILISQERIKKIHLIYGCVTGALVFCVAAALIVGCVGIYQSGDRPFTREVIAAALQSIAVPGWLCLAAVAGGIFLRLALPLAPSKPSPLRDDLDTLARYPREGRTAEGKKRLIWKTVTGAVIGLLAIYPVIYYADASHFGVTDLSGDIFRALLVALIPTGIALVCVYVCSRACAASVKREIDALKASGVKPGKAQASASPQKGNIARWICFAAAAVLLILGIANGGYQDVLSKAIKICTECIGLG